MTKSANLYARIEPDIKERAENILTVQARDDLRNIFVYINFNLQFPQSAADQLDRLEENIFSLKQMPERFRVYDRELWRSRNLRIMPVDNYLVFYIPNHEDNVVTIIRVIYGGRDIDKQLFFLT